MSEKVKQMDMDCPVEGCSYGVIFNSTDSRQMKASKGHRFRKHLQEKHGLADLACVIYRIQLAKLRGEPTDSLDEAKKMLDKAIESLNKEPLDLTIEQIQLGLIEIRNVMDGI